MFEDHKLHLLHHKVDESMRELGQQNFSGGIPGRPQGKGLAVLPIINCLKSRKASLGAMDYRRSLIKDSRDGKLMSKMVSGSNLLDLIFAHALHQPGVVIGIVEYP